MPPADIRILLNPTITPDQLFAFYEKNDICEKGFGKEVAARVLDRSDVIVGAFRGDGGGVRKAAAEMLIRKPFAMGAFSIGAGEVLAGYEEGFYQGLGFKPNEGALECLIDRRRYVIGEENE
jgi:hypothetical protein